MNYKGLVGMEGERLTSELFARYADEAFERQERQLAEVDRFAWLSPMVALRRLSMAVAGTDLRQYRRFVEQAERHRYALVQHLNRLQAEQLSFRGDKSSRDSRIASTHWHGAADFHFEPGPSTCAGAASATARAAAVARGAVGRSACGLEPPWKGDAMNTIVHEVRLLWRSPVSVGGARRAARCCLRSPWCSACGRWPPSTRRSPAWRRSQAAGPGGAGPHPARAAGRGHGGLLHLPWHVGRAVVRRVHGPRVARCGALRAARAGPRAAGPAARRRDLQPRTRARGAVRLRLRARATSRRCSSSRCCTTSCRASGRPAGSCTLMALPGGGRACGSVGPGCAPRWCSSRSCCRCSWARGSAACPRPRSRPCCSPRRPAWCSGAGCRWRSARCVAVPRRTRPR